MNKQFDFSNFTEVESEKVFSPKYEVTETQMIANAIQAEPLPIIPNFVEPRILTRAEILASFKTSH